MADRQWKFNLFVVGDSADINTWSNLPYFFSKALIDAGIQLNRINLLDQANWMIGSYLKIARIWLRLRRIVRKEPVAHDLYRDRVLKIVIEKKIKKACRDYGNADLNIFLTFSFSSHKYSKLPVVHYCDETYELFLEDTGKAPNKKDRYFIVNEHNILEGATHLFATNARCTQFIMRNNRLTNVTTLGGGINAESVLAFDESEILAIKQRNRDILFIGKGPYKRGVDVLIDAFDRFNRRNGNRFTLHIVGIAPERGSDAPRNVVYHGYLRKNDPAELAVYNDLIKRARLFVMPMRHGPPPGVIKEVAWMYTPVITTNIWGMDRLIQNNANGILIDHPDPDAFAEQMNRLANNADEWEGLARRAHRMSEGTSSWDDAIHVFLEVCSGYLPSSPQTMTHRSLSTARDWNGAQP